MKKIKLTQGKVALVDDADYEELSTHKWYAHKNSSGNFYAMRWSPRVKSRRFIIQMAREILGLEYGDKRQADHIDHNTLDNRHSNLRICTNQENARNQKPNQNSSSKYKGVYWSKQKKRWGARIRINGRIKHLGSFRREEFAAHAYNLAAKRYFGAFALLNKI